MTKPFSRLMMITFKFSCGKKKNGLKRQLILAGIKYFLKKRGGGKKNCSSIHLRPCTFKKLFASFLNSHSQSDDNSFDF